jgi:hypothetical protein
MVNGIYGLLPLSFLLLFFVSINRARPCGDRFFGILLPVFLGA